MKIDIIIGRRGRMDSKKIRVEKIVLMKDRKNLCFIFCSIGYLLFILFIIFMFLRYKLNVDAIMVGYLAFFAVAIYLPGFFLGIKNMKEIKHLNYLVDNGMIIEGEILNVASSMLGTIGLDVQAYDDNGKKYVYSQEDHKIYDVDKLRAYVRENPFIYILVNKNDYSDGRILIKDYMQRIDWNKLAYEKKWDGSYVSTINYEGQMGQQSDLLRKVDGTLLSGSLKKVSSYTDGTILMKAEVIFFDKESGENLIFPCQARIGMATYSKVKNIKGNLKVPLLYNIQNHKEYTVYLETALERYEQEGF